MNLSLIINTVAGTTDEEILNKRGSRDNASKKPYRLRAANLEEMLSRYARLTFNWEVFVVGEWHDGEGYTYIHDPGKLKDPCDQAQQRNTGFAASQGDIVFFMNDDHYLPEQSILGAACLLATNQCNGLGFSYRLIKDGIDKPRKSAGRNKHFLYIPGHASAFQRKVIEHVPWQVGLNTVHSETDVYHSRRVEEAGYRIWHFTPFPVYDIEIGEFPNE
jgi:hypothetical protein